jgi:RNA polymerase sigma-70 factor (ECF subfamily)
MGSDTDFEQVVEDHHAALYRFALSLSRNDADAADLVQQTFYVWAKKGHQLGDIRKAKSWLFTTLHREFMARRRRQRRFPQLDLSEVEEDLLNCAPTVPDQLDWDVLASSLAKVEPAFQSCVVLFYLEDYSYNEIAHVLDIPLGTVKSRIARGVARLHRLLTEQPDREPSTPGSPE